MAMAIENSVYKAWLNNAGLDVCVCGDCDWCLSHENLAAIAELAAFDSLLLESGTIDLKEAAENMVSWPHINGGR